jgi:aminoglycoside phosphotransferase (APT) family kinase protein
MVTRTVTLVIAGPDGEPGEELPPFEAPTPWWQDVAGFAELSGVDGLQVLRMLSADRPAPPGGNVRYLVQAEKMPARKPEEPARPPYAEIGGPDATLDWARTVLGDLITPHQVRTWNLSAIWRLDDSRGNPVIWLKQVPKFFAHEAEAIRLVSKLAPALVPYVVVEGAEGRILMRHVPGRDGYGAGPELREHVLAAWHPVQTEFVRFLTDDDRRRTIEATIPDGRLGVERFAKVAAPYLDTIDGLRELIDDLPQRLAAVRECGIPDTVVHGDLHVGNVRTDETGLCTIIDWGDCFIGHPAFDLLRLAEGLDDASPLIDQWAYRWTNTMPGSNPHRAVKLLRPVAALREAAVYTAFLDAIEPAEWPYHAADVPAALTRAASMVDW